RYVNCLNRGNRSFACTGDSFLQFPHFCSQIRLISDSRGHSTEQSRYFRSCLGEAEDVIDKQQYVLTLFIPKVFGNRQSGQGHSEPSSRRFRHLPIDQSCLVDDAGFVHLQPEIIPFARSLTDSREHRKAAVLSGNPVDQLHDDYCFPDTGAAEETDLTRSEEHTSELQSREKLACRLLIEKKKNRGESQRSARAPC